MWLLRQELATEMSRNYRLFGGTPTAAARERFDAFLASTSTVVAMGGSGSSLPRCASVAGDTLQICVDGVLTNRPNFWAWLMGMGNCTYESIRQALAYAAADSNIKRIAWMIGSGGGQLTGLFETLAAIEMMSKPMTVMASEACSAAYAIAVKAGKITASTVAAEFGSIGVAQHFCFDNDETEIDVTSTEAPNKRPDVRTPEGKAVVVAELDAIHELFVSEIASARGTSPKNVNATFGRGAVFVAGQAKKLGMIDKISKPMPASVRSGSDMPDDGNDEDGNEDEELNKRDSAEAIRSIETVDPPSADAAQPQEPPAAPQAKPESSAGAEQKPQKGVHMDLATLMAQHPELYKQIVETAKAEATTAERDRVNAHVEMGKSSGAMDVALSAIADGSPMTQTLMAKYMSAGMNRSAQAARQADDATAEAAVGTAAAGTTDTQDLGDQVVALMNSQENGVVLLPAKK